MSEELRILKIMADSYNNLPQPHGEMVNRNLRRFEEDTADLQKQKARFEQIKVNCENELADIQKQKARCEQIKANCEDELIHTNTSISYNQKQMKIMYKGMDLIRKGLDKEENLREMMTIVNEIEKK